jgi:phosphoribosyl 1,2-cyclic phosphate phosphodiesterase
MSEMPMKVTILGCGSSSGVPVIGCDCEVCQSNNPKNKRLRVSILIEVDGKRLLVDTSPDLRQQALDNKINYVDAILYTHEHADHVHGIDDIRSFNYHKNESLPVYADPRTMEALKKRFGYIFQPKPEKIWYRASVTPHVLTDEPIQHFSAEGVAVTAFMQTHGRTTSLGYRIGNFAYSTDTDQMPETAFEALQGIDTWVVDCLRYTPSMTHSTVERTLGWIKRAKPRRAILTHMGHELDYSRLLAELPEGVVPGYDGMVIEL